MESAREKDFEQLMRCNEKLPLNLEGERGATFDVRTTTRQEILGYANPAVYGRQRATAPFSDGGTNVQQSEASPRGEAVAGEPRGGRTMQHVARDSPQRRINAGGLSTPPRVETETLRDGQTRSERRSRLERPHASILERPRVNRVRGEAERSRKKPRLEEPEYLVTPPQSGEDDLAQIRDDDLDARKAASAAAILDQLLTESPRPSKQQTFTGRANSYDRSLEPALGSPSAPHVSNQASSRTRGSRRSSSPRRQLSTTSSPRRSAGVRGRAATSSSSSRSRRPPARSHNSGGEPGLSAAGDGRGSAGVVVGPGSPVVGVASQVTQIQRVRELVREMVKKLVVVHTLERDAKEYSKAPKELKSTPMIRFMNLVLQVAREQKDTLAQLFEALDDLEKLLKSRDSWP